MKIALVHDYLKEYGGAERVLQALHEIWPEAPIYTAFIIKNSAAGKAFAGARVIESRFASLIKHKNLYSPLRFLAPLIWKSFDFSAYDLVITSASWYVTRGFGVGPRTKVICYCHTPPRYLYGYATSIEWQRYWPVKVYAAIVNHFMRIYDFNSAQQVDEFIVNSKNVEGRVKKFYRRDSTVIYPPVEVEKIIAATRGLKPKDYFEQSEKQGSGQSPGSYFLIVSRIVGAKGIEMAAEAAKKARVKIKVIGEPAGLRWFGNQLEGLENPYLEFLGRVPDDELYQYYGKCKAFLALAEDEDFGITPVEAMAAGRPVIAFRGGGYLETVISPSASSGCGATGEFFAKPTVESLVKTLKNFKPGNYKPEDCRKQARKFSKKRFVDEIKNFVKTHARAS